MNLDNIPFDACRLELRFPADLDGYLAAEFAVWVEARLVERNLATPDSCRRGSFMIWDFARALAAGLMNTIAQRIARDWATDIRAELSGSDLKRIFEEERPAFLEQVFVAPAEDADVPSFMHRGSDWDRFIEQAAATPLNIPAITLGSQPTGTTA
jgi:hypothetical protein